MCIGSEGEVLVMTVAGRIHPLYRWGRDCRGRIPSGGGSGGEPLMYVLELVVCFGRKLVEFM